MAALFPTAIKTFTVKTDGVDDVQADHINSLQDEVTAIETQLLTAWMNTTITMTGSGGTAGAYAEDQTYARYTVIGKTCFVVARKRITNLGSWSGDVRFSYPVAAASGGAAPKIGNGYVYATGAAIASPKGVASIANGNFGNFYRTAISLLQWSDMAINDYVFLNIAYEIG